MSEELKLKLCPLCGGKADFWGGTGAGSRAQPDEESVAGNCKICK